MGMIEFTKVNSPYSMNFQLNIPIAVIKTSLNIPNAIY